MPSRCSRIRLGGTVSGSTISGGTSVQNDAIFVTTLAGLMGHPGRRGSNVLVPFLDGSLRRPRKRSNPRLLTLTVEVMDRDANGLIPTTRGVQWEANMDTLLRLVDAVGESVIVERDMADGTVRWIEAEILQPFDFTNGMRTSSHVSYLGVIPLEAHHPYWQSSTETTKPFATALVPPGNATLFNQILSFSTAGTLVHTQSADTITASAGSFPLIVDCGRRLVTQAGVDASNRIVISSAAWMRLPSGVSATFSGSATGNMLYRSQWL